MKYMCIFIIELSYESIWVAFLLEKWILTPN